MKAIEFPEQTLIIAKNQPQYIPLPVHARADEAGTLVACYEFDEAERAKIAAGGKLWVSVLTFGDKLQPMRLELDKPEMDNRGRVVTDAFRDDTPSPLRPMPAESIADVCGGGKDCPECVEDAAKGGGQ